MNNKMQTSDDKIDRHIIETRAKAPTRRPPLPRMMDKPNKRKIQRSEIQNLKQIEESNDVDDEIFEDPYTNSLESDSNPKVIHPSSLPKLLKPSELPNTQAEPSSEKYKKISIPNCSTKSKKSDSKKKIEETKGTCRKNIIAFFIVIIAVLCVFGIFPSIRSIHDGEQALQHKRIENFKASINDMSHRFKNQHSNIWDEIYSGVLDIIEHPKKRSVFFLFSNDDDPMFCLAKMVGNAAKEVLHTDHNLWLEPSEFGNNYGLVLEKLREPIQKRKIVIVENLLDINPEAMRAFHNLCDSENPHVNQTIYIITMIAKGFEENESPIDFVEKQLIKKLKGKINPDKLQPLIARVTDAAIIPVQPEPDIKSCPLRY